MESLPDVTISSPKKWHSTQEVCHADADPNRALLDERVVRDLLGFDRDTYEAVRRLAAK